MGRIDRVKKRTTYKKRRIEFYKKRIVNVNTANNEDVNS
jgi:hypothetical protein